MNFICIVQKTVKKKLIRKTSRSDINCLLFIVQGVELKINVSYLISQ